MKITINKLIILYTGLLAIIFVYLNLNKIDSIDKQIQYIEFVIDIVNIILAIIFFINIKHKNKWFILLPLNIIFLFLMDVQYQIFYYLKILNDFIFYESITFTWYGITLICLILLLTSFVYDRKRNYLLFVSFMLFTIIFIIFFAPNFIKYLYYPYNSIDLTIHIIIFYLCILLIIAVQNKFILLTFVGLCILEIGNFSMTECYLQNNNNLFYGEFLYLVGEFCISIGLLQIIKYKIYNPTTWFFHNNTIRSKFSFIIFSLSIWSFIITCVIIKQLNKFENNSFVFIPAIGMFYAMFTAIVAVILSKQIEKPFLQIQAKIKCLFDGNNKNNHNNTNLIEFQQLNNFIVESYEYKTTLEKHIVSMATRIAHDIKSPIQILENLIKNNKNDMLQEQFIKQINKISFISKSLLKENKRVINDNFYGLQSLYCIIEDLILDKQIEWNTEYSVINFKYNPNQIIWLDSKQAKIKNVISNLLNNSFEASTTDLENIKVIVNLEDQNIIISIQDFGSGMSDETLNTVKKGKTLKVNGNGIGLVTAEKFMNEIHGKFDIKSELNYGTTIKLEFPQLTHSQQFVPNIEISTNHIIVVDDNSTIINFWQEYFLFSRTRKIVEYFINFKSLIDYLSINKYNEGNTTYFLDYHIFGEKMTGIDIIKKYNLKNVYLITNSAEDIKLQDEIKLFDINLVPKTMLNVLLQNNAIRIKTY